MSVAELFATVLSAAPTPAPTAPVPASDDVVERKFNKDLTPAEVAMYCAFSWKFLEHKHMWGFAESRFGASIGALLAMAARRSESAPDRAGTIDTTDLHALLVKFFTILGDGKKSKCASIKAFADALVSWKNCAKNQKPKDLKFKLVDASPLAVLDAIMSFLDWIWRTNMPGADHDTGKIHPLKFETKTIDNSENRGLGKKGRRAARTRQETTYTRGWRRMVEFYDVDAKTATVFCEYLMEIREIVETLYTKITRVKQDAKVQHETNIKQKKERRAQIKAARKAKVAKTTEVTRGNMYDVLDVDEPLFVSTAPHPASATTTTTTTTVVAEMQAPVMMPQMPAPLSTATMMMPQMQAPLSTATVYQQPQMTAMEFQQFQLWQQFQHQQKMAQYQQMMHQQHLQHQADAKAAYAATQAVVASAATQTEVVAPAKTPVDSHGGERVMANSDFPPLTHPEH
jgi:hypothetical protein